jgi:hypothetical protein
LSTGNGGIAERARARPVSVSTAIFHRPEDKKSTGPKRHDTFAAVAFVVPLSASLVGFHFEKCAANPSLTQNYSRL